jgi:hypothetical protein
MKTRAILYFPLLLLCVVCLSGNIFPQEKMSASDRADKMTERLNQQLSFSDDQYKVVHDIIYDYMSTHTRADFDRDELNGEIEKVLSTDKKISLKK